MSVKEGVAEAVAEILAGAFAETAHETKPFVIDADALNAISKDLSILRKMKGTAILTPHEGEMARLTGISTDAIRENRLKAARDFAEKYGVVLVLKGHRTIVALPDGIAYINPTGNPGMATAGAGDVLTGMIAALAAGGLDAGSAAIAAVYLHGLAGDIAAERLGEASVVAGDIVSHIAPAIKTLNIQGKVIKWTSFSTGPGPK
jgi:NAD(P)H-hydrate epimerase